MEKGLDEVLSIEKMLEVDYEKGKNQISELYKRVFCGDPWFEDKVCANVLQQGDAKCDALYTKNPLVKTGGKKIREGVYYLEDTLKTCKGCGVELKLIDYYPNYIDNKAIFSEAFSLKGFVGYVGYKGGELVGFSWGFQVPRFATQSVRFDLVADKLCDLDLNPEKTFYASELGVVESSQNKGFGTELSMRRIEKAAKLGYKDVVLRTINPHVQKIMKTELGVEGRELFKDPINGTPWFAWGIRSLKNEEWQKAKDGQNAYTRRIKPGYKEVVYYNRDTKDWDTMIVPADAFFGCRFD